MHPRNKYKTPIDFNELRKLYPEFAEKVQVVCIANHSKKFTG